MASEPSERKGSQQPANQPARILGYKQPQMLNFRHIQAGAYGAKRDQDETEDEGGRRRNRRKTDSRRQPQANCWQGRKAAAVAGRKLFVGRNSRLTENENEMETETETENETPRPFGSPVAPVAPLCIHLPLQPPSKCACVGVSQDESHLPFMASRAAGLPCSLASPHSAKKWRETRNKIP